MRRVYLLPEYASNLKNSIFKLVDPTGVNAFPYVRKYLLERGIELNTIDYFNFNLPEPGAVLLVLNHPDESFIKKIFHKFRSIYRGQYYGGQEYLSNYKKYFKYFAHKILFQLECPVILPRAYKNINELVKIYDDVYSTIITNGFHHFFFPLIPSPHSLSLEEFNNSERKRLILLSSNKSAFGRENELYSERLRAIKYFSDSDFDLYGYGWDRRPALPYLLFSKYIRRVYRGPVGKKSLTLSKYRYAICFENAKFEGYLTEKIIDCLFAGTIPIYYGAPDIEKYIPRECFIDFRMFKSYEDLDVFLKNMTEAQIGSYRSAALEFVNKSSKLNLFSEENYSETIYKAIQKVIS